MENSKYILVLGQGHHSAFPELSFYSGRGAAPAKLGEREFGAPHTRLSLWRFTMPTDERLIFSDDDVDLEHDQIKGFLATT